MVGVGIGICVWVGAGLGAQEISTSVEAKDRMNNERNRERIMLALYERAKTGFREAPAKIYETFTVRDLLADGAASRPQVSRKFLISKLLLVSIRGTKAPFLNQRIAYETNG